MKRFLIFAVLTALPGAGCGDRGTTGEEPGTSTDIAARGDGRSTTPAGPNVPVDSPRPAERRQSPSEPLSIQSTGKTTYAGLTLAEWRERIKNLDPQGPESAAAVPGLIAIVEDPGAPWFSRRQAALTLGRIGPQARVAVPVLVRLLAEVEPQQRQNRAAPEDSPRLWAVKALALFGPEARTATPPLTAILEDRSQPLAHRLAVMEALARIGTAHPDALAALIAALNRPTGDRVEIAALREAAAEAIGLVGPPAQPAVPALLRALSDDNEALRRRAVAAIGAMGSRGEIALQALVDRLAFDDSPAVRDAAAEALGSIGLQAVPALMRLIESGDAEIRWRAALALAKIGPPARAAAPALDALLDDESPQVRLHAAEALWKIGADAQLVAAALVQEFTSEDRQVRMRAYRMLLAMGPQARAAIGPLRKLLGDSRGYVRSTAARALREIEAMK